MPEYAFILAGGAGTRLWPVSRRNNPKQFMKIGEHTLLQETVLRVFRCGEIRKAVIICGEDQLQAVANDIEQLDFQEGEITLLPEPEGRNTAPAVALGLKYLIWEGNESGGILIVPSDHLVQPDGAYRSDLNKAEKLYNRGYIVTFGIIPNRPETGYGYIQATETIPNGKKVDSFREKPDLKTASRYIAEGNYYWDTGMFSSRGSTFIDEYENHYPELYDFINDGNEFRIIRNGNISSAYSGEGIRSAYGKIRPISFDHAVMEKTGKAAVIPASFRWNDIGSWDEYAAFAEAPGAGIPVESKGNSVFSEIPVALCGVEDLIVVNTEDAILICKKGKSQDVKKVVEKLKKSDFGDLL